MAGTTTLQSIRSENISPRARFQESGVRLSDVRDLITKDIFRTAIDAALLQYQSELAVRTTDANAAMRTGLCVLGAHEFVTVLRQLAEKEEAPKILKHDDNLPHRS